MGFLVSDETKQKTTNCKKDFACLNGNGSNLCAVEHCVDGKVHFIRCIDQSSCSYRSSFGNGFYCDCPIRKELYNKYGI